MLCSTSLALAVVLERLLPPVSSVPTIRLIKKRGSLGHVYNLQREMTHAGISSTVKAPLLYPDYGSFDLREHARLKENHHG